MYRSWGRTFDYHHKVIVPNWTDDIIDFSLDTRFLPYGRGRSYGDSCLNADHTLIATNNLKRFRQFDPKLGILICESGVQLAEVIDLITPYVWFLPVTPGTKYITLGGAIAADVHGKNHHHKGCFSECVHSLQLMHPDGSEFTCSKTENTEMFRAT